MSYIEYSHFLALLVINSQTFFLINIVDFEINAMKQMQ